VNQAARMQTAFEVLFVLALVLPPVAVAGGMAAVVAVSSLYWRPHAAVGRYRPVRG
jgi:ABC-type molybdate transport system permease subunit